MAEKRTKVKHIIPIILRTKLTEIIGSIQKKLFGENTAKKGEENQEYNDRDQTILLEKKIVNSQWGILLNSIFILIHLKSIRFLNSVWTIFSLWKQGTSADVSLA